MQNLKGLLKGKITVVLLTLALAVTFLVQVHWAYAWSMQPENRADIPEQRSKYIQSFGWQVGECAEEKSVVLPQTFSKVYQNYNVLQKQQGFDLQPYAGRQCTVYTYPLLNFPGQPQDVFLHLMVCDGQVIGGDIASVDLQGFIIPFK